jgi:hypothetical protein
MLPLDEFCFLSLSIYSSHQQELHCPQHFLLLRTIAANLAVWMSENDRKQMIP